MSKSISNLTWMLKNYLNKHGIYQDNHDMQNTIINAFYIQYPNHSVEDVWGDKIKFIHSKFGKFCQYAQNNWKHNQNQNENKKKPTPISAP